MNLMRALPNHIRILGPLLLLLGLGACSDSVQVTDLGKVQKPAGHDQMVQEATQPKAYRVEVPVSVRAKYKSVEIGLKMPKGGEAIHLQVPIGGYAREAKRGIEVAAKDYLPSFSMAGERITTREGGPENPAVWVDVRVHGKEVFRGWVFRDEPGLTAPLVPGYSVDLLGVKTVAEEGKRENEGHAG